MNYITYALYAVGGGFLSLLVLELAYIIVMGLDGANKQGKLPPWFVKVGKVFAAVGLVWDVLCNVFITTFIFMELPREATISQRLRRLVQQPTGWRKPLAVWFSVNLLNPFSYGKPHIKIPNDDSNTA